jgi:hypothetical protein
MVTVLLDGEIIVVDDCASHNLKISKMNGIMMG